MDLFSLAELELEFRFYDIVGSAWQHGAPPFGMMVLVPWTQVAGALCDIRRKGHLTGSQVTFFDAYGVSCRARVEEADPTAKRRLAPFIGSPAAVRDLGTHALGDWFYDFSAADFTTVREGRQIRMSL